MAVTSILSKTTVDEADAVIISAPYEHTASSRKGTQFGPSAIVSCLDTKLEFFDRDFGCQPNEAIQIHALPELDLQKLSPEEALNLITEQSEKIVNAGKFPLLLGGEHSVSLGLLQAIAKKFNPHNVTILQIDAHCDLRDNDGDYSDNPSKLAHSCVLRRAHELGYHLVQVGIRTYSKEEHDYFADEKNGIKVFQWGNRQVPEISEIISTIKTKYVYLTIDVDGFDPSCMPGTGTPVQGGLEWWYGLSLVKEVIRKFDVLGADVVEVSPMSDSVVTEYGASQLCYSIINHKFANKLQKNG